MMAESTEDKVVVIRINEGQCALLMMLLDGAVAQLSEERLTRDEHVVLGHIEGLVRQIRDATGATS